MRASFTIWIAALCASALFALWPQVDLWVSQIFYAPDAAASFPGAGFIGRRSEAIELVREISRVLPFYIMGASVLLAGITYFGLARLFFTPRAVLFLASAMALGPGLLVNAGFKEFSGRARPMQIVEFGGDKQFSPAWTLADQCQTNCSFVSGEVSMAAWTLALVLLVPAPARAIALALSAAYMALSALLRIAAGAHFLSDAVVAIIVTQLCTLLLYALFYRTGAKSA